MGFAWDAVNEVLKIITSLQQEQPGVDLEKEIDNYLIPIEHWEIEDEPIFWMKQIARDFYELGRARKEE